MKKYFYSTILLFLSFSSLLNAQNIINNGYNGAVISSLGASGSNFYAQSFIATVNEITKFGVFLQEIESGGEVILSIAADNGSGSPNINAPLYQGTLKNPSTVGAWFYEEGINVFLTVGQKYWVVIDGYNNAGATGRSGVGLSANLTNSGESMIYSNNAGGNWSSIPSSPLAIYVGLTTVIDENNGHNESDLVSSIGATGSTFYAQSFIAGVNEISTFGVFLREIEAGGELILSVAADNGSGAPNISAPLYEGKLVNPSAIGSWFYESGINIPVTVGQKYWIVVDGYNNAGATGRSSVGFSTAFTSTGEGMIYTNGSGVGAWNSIPSKPLAIYISGSNAVIDVNNGHNGNLVTSIGQTGSDFYGQSFLATLDTITKFGVFLTEIESGGELILSIAADNGSGAPNINAPLYEGTLKNPSAVGAWFYEGGIKVPVTVGQKYWIVIDGYNNSGATGRSGVGASANFTNTGEGITYSNNGGVGSWSSVSSMPLAIYVSGIRKFPVTFEVSDTTGGETNLVSGVNISFDKYGNKLTNGMGLAVYDSVYFAGSDTLNWLATKTGYYTQTGQVVISDTTTISIILKPIPVYSVTFNVSNINGAPIADATVSLEGYGEVVTDESGKAAFYSVPETLAPEIPFNLNASGYLSVSGNLIVKADTVLDIELTLLSYSITFHVTEGLNDIEGVEVTLADYGSAITDANGMAVFENVLHSFGESVAYEVSGEEINTANGDVVADMDKTVDVAVSRMVGIPEVSAKRMVVYPNPAKEVVNVASPEEIQTMDIITLKGTSVKKVTGSGKNAQIAVSELPEGIYILVVRTGIDTYLKRFTIVK